MLRIRRSRLIGSVVVLLALLLGSCWLSLGLSINISSRPRPIDQLMTAQTKWQNRYSTDYSMWIKLHSFSLIGTYKISVTNNQVVSVQDGKFEICDTCPLKAADAQAISAYQTAFGKAFPPTFTDLTMDNLFAFAADKIKDEPIPPILSICSAVDTDHWRYEATYDETQGYITSLRYTNCPRYNGGGLLCPGISECSTEITISNLQSQN